MEELKDEIEKLKNENKILKDALSVACYEGDLYWSQKNTPMSITCP